jgi:endonuclease YncB( thermonuclease family)
VPVATALADTRSEEPAPLDTAIAYRLDPNIVYPAEVLRIIDGDMFEARVRVWSSLDVDTKIRLRGIDAAELHTRCAAELARAQAARTALQAMLADGGVTISRVGNSTMRRRCSMAALRALMMAASGSWCG